MIFNKAEGWGADAKFRQAVQALLNVGDVLYAYFGDENFYKLYSSYMFTGSKWYTEAGAEFYDQGDKDKALALFAEAGFTADDTFTILCASDSQDFYAFAQVIQAQFREAGLKCDLLGYEWGTFTQIRNNEPEKYNAFITSFSPKLLPNLNLFLSASWAGWCTDERVQGDLASIATSTDVDGAMATWEALQAYMYEDYVPIVKFGASTNMTVWSADLQGVGYQEWLVWVNASPVGGGARRR
jgi:peptide/nickel transport system substrate-binding protein